MRIAIYENLPPGGAKRTAFEFGRFLAQRHEVDLYRLSITSTRAFDLAPHVRQVFTYPFAPARGLLDGRLREGRFAPRSFTLFGPLRRVHRRIAADLRQRGYDVVLAHTDAMTQSPYLLRWLDPVPNLYYCHDVFRVRDERELLRSHRQELSRSRPPLGAARMLEDLVVLNRLAGQDVENARSATHIAVNSVYSRERVWAAYARNAWVCPPGVDIERFSPPAAGAVRRREILSIGGPPAIKGHDLVIDALARVDTGLRPALRVIMPTDRDAGWLRERAVAAGVRLTVETGIDEDALVERYRSALATICAARLEPFGLTPLESMACATPVIAIEEAGYRETVRHDLTGLLTDPGADALAAAITALCRDPQRVAALGRAGRDDIVKRWTWQAAGSRLETALLKIAEGQADAAQARASGTGAAVKDSPPFASSGPR